MAGTGSGWETPGFGNTGSGGFGGSGFNLPKSAPAKGGGGGGGGIGGFFGGLGHDLVKAAHWTASKGELAGKDIKGIPGGIAQQFVTGAPFVTGLLGGNWSGVNKKSLKAFGNLEKAQVENLKTTARHPLRDPFNTALWVTPGLDLAGRGLLGAGTLAHVGPGLRLLKEPRLIAQPGREPVSLFGSRNAARRIVQAGIDKAVNHALAHEGGGPLNRAIAGYGKSRAGGTLAEVARARIRYRQALVSRTRQAAIAINRYAKGIKEPVGNAELTVQALLHSLHDNVLPEQAAIMHEQAAARGINPEHNLAWARAYKDAAKLGVVRPVAGEQFLHLAPDHPMAKAVADMQKAGDYVEHELTQRDVRSPEALAERRALAGKVTVRGNPLKGPEPQALSDARRALVKAQARHEKNLQLDEQWRAGKGPKSNRGPGYTPGGIKVSARDEEQVASHQQYFDRAQARVQHLEDEIAGRRPRSFAPGVAEGELPGARAALENSRKLLEEAQSAKPIPEQSNPLRNQTVLSGQKLEEARARVQRLEDKYGISSPERRAAAAQGLEARQQMHDKVAELFGPEEAARQLAQADSIARQWARVHDTHPAELYSHILAETSTPETIAHLPEDIAPLYEAVPPLPHEELPQVVGHDVAAKVLARPDIKLPKGWQPEDLAAVVDRIMPLVEEGAPYRDWYQRGAAVIKEAADRIGKKVGKKLDSRKFLNDVAITSQGANPTMNLRMAARAAEQYLREGQITQETARVRFPQRQIPELLDAMAGKTIESSKRNSYYGNFLHEIDPKQFAKEFGARLDPVTVDRHIARMLFDTQSPTALQYKLGEAVFQEIAKQLGWKAKEVQAAAWIPWKARGIHNQQTLTAAGRPGVVVREGEAQAAGADSLSRRGHVYRGMTKAEYDATVGSGHGVASTGAYSLPGEGTNFSSDFGTAEDYINFGRDDPRKTGEQTYVVEAKQPKEMAANRQGYFEAHEPLPATRVWRITPEHGNLVARETKPGGYGRFLPSAADAYERGHAENIKNALYHEQGGVIRGAYHPPIDTADLHEAVADAQQPNGGFTLHRDLTLDRPDASWEGQHAFSLAPYEERVHPAELTPERIAQYAAKWRSVLANDPSLRIGGWHDPSTGLVDLDITRVTSAPREEAMAVARNEGQLAMLDRGAFARNDFENAFPETGLSAPEADVIKSAARARVTPEEAVPGGLGGRVELSAQHAVPETVTHELMHALRQSLPPVLEQYARELYHQGDTWTRDGEEQFAQDMVDAAAGHPRNAYVERLYEQAQHFLPGRLYTPQTIYEKGASGSPIASSPSPIVGEARNPMNTHFASGEAMHQGLRRTDVVDAIASHAHQMMRFFNTLDHRDLVAKHGGDVRLAKDDVLVREDRRTEAGFKLPAQKVNPEIQEVLGKLEDVTKLPAGEQEGYVAGVRTALQDLAGNLFPKLGSDVQLQRFEQEAAVGAKAPAGYKWVPKQIANLDELSSSLRGPGDGFAAKIGRLVDNINGAVTGATVYYKIGHVFTRVFTNAAANIIHGAANPLELRRSVELWQQLTPDERMEALTYSGTHYYESAPGAEGQTLAARGLQKGLHVPFTDKALRTKSGVGVMSPQWWAQVVDAPFRFAALAREARLAGFEGADGLRQFLSNVHDYNGLDAAERARVDTVLRRADREAIAYDRLNAFEKRYIARAIWFYPWIKGSTVFTVNTLLEHPYKALGIGLLGVEQRQRLQQQLGDVPSYASGLFLLSHGQMPLVTDLNTFSPLSTTGDVLMVPEHLQNLAGMLNPAVGAGVGTAESVDSYGTHTPSPVLSNFGALPASTPEWQIIQALLNRGADQSHKLYPGGHGSSPLYKTWLGELVRGLAGPAAPRHVNPLAAHSLAKREKTGR